MATTGYSEPAGVASSASWDPGVRVRGSALAVAVLNALVLLCFALPFASVSCGTARTETLTGWELASGADAGIRTEQGEPGHVTPSPSEDAAEVRATLRKLRAVVRMEFLLAAVGVVVAATALVRSSLAGEAARSFLLPGAVVSAMSFVAAIAVGAGEAFGPEVHHYEGFWMAFGLAAVGIVPALVYARSENEWEEDVPDGLQRFQWIGSGAAVFGGLLVAAPAGPLGLLVGAVVAVPLFLTGLFALAFMRPASSSFVAAILGGVVVAFLVAMF
jgi:hypothetical protein